jgi:NAD+ kinase
MNNFTTIGVIGKTADPGIAPALRTLTDYLSARGCNLRMDAATASHLGLPQSQGLKREQLATDCDLVVVVGGDGTLLDAARAVAPKGVPLLGVNRGRLGFMVDVLPAELEHTLDAVFSGQYVREERLMLSASVMVAGREMGPFYALNDVVIRNRDFARIIEFDTYTDGCFISHHRADGIVIATPTGSTAYALSSGGPVLHPALPAIALVPICPHTLSDRPLVLDAGRVIEVVIDPSQATQALVTCDGQVHQELNSGDRVHIRRSERSVHLIHPPGYDYFKLLRSKLQWGRGPSPRDASARDLDPQ